MKRRYGVIAGALMGLAVNSAFGQAAPETQLFTAILAPVNSSGVTAVATVALSGNQLTVLMAADGLEPGIEHQQYIFGPAGAQGQSACPTLAADQNTDNLVSLEEGAAVFGNILVPLTPFPTPAEGTVQFAQSYALDPQTLQNLQAEGGRAIVLHGLTVQGAVNPTLPVACGELRPVGGAQEQEQQQQQQGS